MKRIILALVAASLLTALHAESTYTRDKSAAPSQIDICIVSGEKLGGMGAPYRYVHRADGEPDRLVMLCCEMCVGRFQSNPERYLAKLDKMLASGKADHADDAESCCEDGGCELHAAETEQDG